MLHHRLPLRVLPILLLVAIACSRSTLTATWKDSDRHTNYSRLAVVGIATSEGTRRLFEDAMVEVLLRSNLSAMQSYAAVPEQDLRLERLQQPLRARGVDAILVSRVIAVENETQYVPVIAWRQPYYLRYNRYYFHSLYHPFFYDQGYYVTRPRIALETNLYDADDGRLVWSAQSETRDLTDSPALARSVGELLAKELIGQKLVSHKDLKSE